MFLRRRLAAEKWVPVVVEVLEDRGRVDGANFDIIEARVAKKAGERLGAANGKTRIRIRLVCARIECLDGIPKMTEHLHFAVEIPDVRTDDSARSHDSHH